MSRGQQRRERSQRVSFRVEGRQPLRLGGPQQTLIGRHQHQIVASGTTLPNLGLDLQGQLHLLLTGTVDTNKTVVFDGLPDIPIAHFQLTFNGPPQGLLVANRDLCLPPTPLFHEDFFGYNGASSSQDTASGVENCGPKPATGHSIRMR